MTVASPVHPQPALRRRARQAPARHWLLARQRLLARAAVLALAGPFGLACAQTVPAAPAAVTPAAAASAPAAAATTPADVPNAAGAKTPQRVEIIGSTDPNAERRRSTASKIIIGRDEIERMGDSTLGEVLKRLPGVTTGGPPGRGGPPRMRGMGGGYTAILIDGQRMPMGFSLDSIAPEQIERIEILRTPTAEMTARGVAGIINVVMREDFRRKANEFRFGGGLEDGRRPSGGGSWNYSGQNDALGYNFSAATLAQHQGDESVAQVLNLDALGIPTLEQNTHSVSINRRANLFLNGRLQFRLAPGHTLDLQPFANFSRANSQGSTTLAQTLGSTPAPFALAQYSTRSDSSMGRLGGTWLRTVGDGGRLQLRFGARLAQSGSLTARREYAATSLQDGAATGAPSRLKVDDGSVRDVSLDLNGKYTLLIAERHSVAAGWDLEAGRRSDKRVTSENGAATLTEFGDTLQARTLRLAAFAQDEWDWSPSLSFYLGARWEGIQTGSDGLLGQSISNRSSVLTPLAHMVWKLPDAPRDQIRVSLGRTYKSPTTAQLIARPVISNLYPNTAKANEPTSPDRAGNPLLKPELAWGLDTAFEHYLDGGGLVSANLFVRSIDNLIRSVRRLETAAPPSAPRWVARPQNIGSALSAGLELEAKLRASDLWATELPLSLRSNLSLMTSRVDGVQGPNNRLDQQPRYTFNLGGDWSVKGAPLTLGGNLNFTPSFVIQQIDAQTYRQGVKRVLDGYALWRISPEASLRLSVANASARDYATGSTLTLADDSTQAQDTLNRSYTTVSLRAELRF